MSAGKARPWDWVAGVPAGDPIGRAVIGFTICRQDSNEKQADSIA